MQILIKLMNNLSQVFHAVEHWDTVIWFVWLTKPFHASFSMLSSATGVPANFPQDVSNIQSHIT